MCNWVFEICYVALTPMRSIGRKETIMKKQKSKQNKLRVFFAVTVTSVYRVVILGTKKTPYLKKIAYRGGESGVKVGGRIENGTMISVGNQLILFVPEGHGPTSPMTSVERDIAKVNTRYWGGRTSKVVALFLNKDDSFSCSGSENLHGNDPRWEYSTIEVLRAIGEDHPYCSITNYPDMRLMPKEDWRQ